MSRSVSYKGSRFGIDARTPRLWLQYLSLERLATDKQLMDLTNHPRPVIRCYSFKALVKRKHSQVFPILLNHLSDTSRIITFYGGCEVTLLTVGDFFFNEVKRSTNNPAGFPVNSQQQLLIDSVLIFRATAAVGARRKLLADLPPVEAYYSRLRYLALEKQDLDAALALAGFKKKQDIAYFQSLQKDSSEAVRQVAFRCVYRFPEASIPILGKTLQRRGL